jgi:hypothetical protein
MAALMLAALMLAAQAMATAEAQAQAQAQSNAQAPQSGPILEPLGNQTAPAGMCGAYLWSRTPGQRDRDLLALATPTAVLVRVGGALRALRRVSAQGEALPGYFTRQRFADGEMSVDLVLTYAPQAAPGEAPVIRSGLVKLTGARGWQTIAPVAGWVSCAPPGRARQ